jgi:hypothetical protein
MFAAAGTEQENVHAMQPEWEVAKPCRSHESPSACKRFPVIPDGAHGAPIRNLELVLR